jgi:hypothetical protein
MYVGVSQFRPALCCMSSLSCWVSSLADIPNLLHSPEAFEMQAYLNIARDAARSAGLNEVVVAAHDLQAMETLTCQLAKVFQYYLPDDTSGESLDAKVEASATTVVLSRFLLPDLMPKAESDGGTIHSSESGGYLSMACDAAMVSWQHARALHCMSCMLTWRVVTMQ